MSFNALYSTIIDGISNEADSGTQDTQLGIIYQSAFLPITYTVIPNGLKPFSLHGESALPTREVIILPVEDWGRWTGQCVGWVRYQTGWNISGNAIQWQFHINSEVPEVNSVIVLNLGKWGHIGVVISVDREAKTLTYRSRNQDGWYVISDTTISFDDPNILGFIEADAF